MQRDPDGGRVLYIESMAGGPRMLEARRRVLGEFEQRAQDFLDSTPPASVKLDLPATALVGATRAIVSRHLRTDAEDQLPALADDLVAWLEAYAIPAGQARWSTGPAAQLPAEGAQRSSAPRAQARAAQRLPRGRHGLPAGVVARSQRTRIIYGTAEVMMAKGYANATVADIVAAAGVARDVFYEHFTDKHHAFMEAQQHPTQHILDTCAAAYFAAERWPERVWQGLSTLIELIVENPAISHLRLVECYAAGPEAIRRAEEITRSFTIFLEEGYRYRPQAEELPAPVLPGDSRRGLRGHPATHLPRRGRRAGAAAAAAHLHCDRPVYGVRGGDPAGGAAQHRQPARPRSDPARLRARKMVHMASAPFVSVPADVDSVGRGAQRDGLVEQLGAREATAWRS